MARQRNNIVRLPYELRHQVSKMLFEGATYADVRRAMDHAGAELPVHNTSLIAWQKGKEYREYCDVRKGFDKDAKAARLAAVVMNDGKGPQSLADIAEYELLQEIVTLAQEVDDTKAASQLAKAIHDLKRTQIAGALEKQITKCKRLEERLREQKEQYESEKTKLRENIEALQQDGRKVDPIAVADGLNQILGMPAVTPAPEGGSDE